jgi:hypothetical protein
MLILLILCPIISDIINTLLSNSQNYYYQLLWAYNLLWTETHDTGEKSAILSHNANF